MKYLALFLILWPSMAFAADVQVALLDDGSHYADQAGATVKFSLGAELSIETAYEYETTCVTDGGHGFCTGSADPKIVELQTVDEADILTPSVYYIGAQVEVEPMPAVEPAKVKGTKEPKGRRPKKDRATPITLIVGGAAAVVVLGGAAVVRGRRERDQ